MNPPDTDVLNFIKDFVWVPFLGLVGWAWNRNEKEHEVLKIAHQKLQDNTSSGYSVLNDRVMEHIDKQVTDVRQFVIHEDLKLMAELGVQRGHIGKVFDKMEAHAIRSEDRHLETLAAIHSLANTMHIALSNKADK